MSEYITIGLIVLAWCLMLDRDFRKIPFFDTVLVIVMAVILWPLTLKIAIEQSKSEFI